MGQPDPSPREWSTIRDHTPNGLLDEVEQYGVQAVWNASLKAVGFPFTWASTAAEYNAIKQSLKGNSHGTLG